MQLTERDAVFDALSKPGVAISSWDGLSGPITDFRVYRDPHDLQIYIEASSDWRTKETLELPPAGTVSPATGWLVFSDSGAEIAIAEGITLRHVNVQMLSPIPGRGKNEKARLQSLVLKTRSTGTVGYVVEWICNVPNSYHWPATVDRLEQTDCATVLNSLGGELRLGKPPAASNGGARTRCCARIEVAGIAVFVGLLPEGSKQAGDGFVVFEGNPEEELRQKLRDGLSFALGVHLVYFGCSAFTGSWDLLTASAVSAVSMTGSVQSLPTKPPAPLDLTYQWWIQEAFLADIVSGVVREYETYKLQAVMWGYRHAFAAPFHIAAIHFAAVVESLQNSYFEHAGPTSSAIVPKAAWRPILKKLRQAVTEAALDGDATDLLLKKISQVNILPQNQALVRCFEKLGLEIGETEQSAWGGRNRAAHGNPIPSEGQVHVIRQNHVLLTIANRMLLALCTKVPTYYDYYSLGTPIRKLDSAIPKD